MLQSRKFRFTELKGGLVDGCVRYRVTRN